MNDMWGMRWRWSVIVLMAFSIAGLGWADWTVSWWERVGIIPVQAAVRAENAFAFSTLYGVPTEVQKREYFEQTLNGGQPFALESQYDFVEVALWVNPPSGLTWRMTFGAKGQLYAFSIDPPPDPSNVVMARSIHERGGVVMFLAWIAWLTYLCLWVSLEDGRRAVAWLGLAFAVYFVVVGTFFLATDFAHARQNVDTVCVASGFGFVALTASGLVYRRTRDAEHRHLYLCRGCGYNLKGNVSGRCPECGLKAPPRKEEPDPAAVAEALGRMTGGVQVEDSVAAEAQRSRLMTPP